MLTVHLILSSVFYVAAPETAWVV